MIQVYNKVSEKHNSQLTTKLNLSHVSNTRGNIYKMQLTHLHYNIPKHFFNRIVAIWNSLLCMVVSAESTNTFKNRLDKFWAHQDFIFDWNVDITGIGRCNLNNLDYA